MSADAQTIYHPTRRAAAEILVDQYAREFDREPAVDAAYEHLRIAEESRGDTIERNGIAVRVSTDGYSVRRVAPATQISAEG